MENQPTEENYNRDQNANPNENFDDEPCPPPGLRRLVTGQTFSFDEGLNSPPFDRVIPGDAEPHQMFPPPAKKNNYGNAFVGDQDFFDSHLWNSNTSNNELISNPNKNKYANQYFTPDTEERGTFLQQGVSHLPPNAYENVNSKNVNTQFNNFKSRPLNQNPVTKAASKVSESILYDSTPQSFLPVNKPENVSKFEHNVFTVQHENDQSIESREKSVSHFQQNSFSPNPEKDIRNDPSNDRMAIEGSCDYVYPKTVSSSTPLQEPKYDQWYEEPYSEDVRSKRDSNISYSGKYGTEKLMNAQSVPLVSLNMHFAQPNVLQAPLDVVNVHSKTPSISSNTSSMNEPSSYQHENYVSEQTRIDHFGNNEILDSVHSLSNYDVPSNVTNKQNKENPSKNYEVYQSDNDFVKDPRQLQKLDINRETSENNDEDREISNYTDSDERPIGKRTVLGYNHNTIPRERKKVEKPSSQDTRTGKQFSYDTSYIKGSKLEPPLEQRLVVGETSNDASVVQNITRSRDDRSYNDEKTRRIGKESTSGRIEKIRKKPSYENRRDRHKIESDDDDYDESLDRSYDDGPGHDSRSYHDLYYRNSSRRFDKRLPRRHPESSFAQSQDESYYDDEDEDDDYSSYRGQRKYYDRKPREPSYRSYYHDMYYREDRKFRRPPPDYYRGYEEDSFFGDRNSRPSSRSGSELFRPLPHPNQRYYTILQAYEYLDHREIVRFAGGPRMKKDEIDYWSKVRDNDKQKYMNWFKNKFPKHYADWYAHYVSDKMLSANSYQPDRRGSGHSGQSSINNDTLSMNDEKSLGMNDQSGFKPLKLEAKSAIHETNYVPSKFTVPHVKGVFNALGQLIEVNACSPQDGQSAKIDIKKLADPNESDWTEFFNFTGPFIPGETHVHTVSQFLKYHAETSNNSSKKLLYLLVDLIIKLRGVADGITMSELLTSSYAESQKTNPLLKKEDDIKQSCDYQGIDEIQIIERYTNLLLQGDKYSALDLAVNHKLWGHAFLLASKMGSKYHSKVLAKFDASILTNNPLKTLYQMHSSQTPLAATACSDEKWGDWRPHLAMILSNPTSDSEFDKTTIITLGDSLAPKDIYAAHFCYLAAGMDFEPPNKPSSKFSLLSLRNSVDHFGINTPNHAILLTQTYEFAKRLQRKDYVISALLPFKYLLAIRLLDYNRSSIALQYLESIALDLMRNFENDHHNLMYNVLELSERIKYSDSKPLVSDSGDKQWLTDLRQFVELTNKPLDHNMSQKVWRQDQLHSSSNFEPIPPTQHLPLISQPSQESPLYNPDELHMFQAPSINQPPLSSPPSLSDSSWVNPTFSQNSPDNVSYSDFSQAPPIKSVDINDNISHQTPNDYDQASNDNFHQQNLYNPWDHPQQTPTITMHSSYNYFNDNTKPAKSDDLHNVSKHNVQRNNSFKKFEMVRNNSYHLHEKLYLLKRLKNKNFNFGNENSLSFLSSSRARCISNFRYNLARGGDLTKCSYHSPSRSKIVFNGTFPIDRPFRIRDTLCNMKSQLTQENNVSKRPSENQTSGTASTQDNDKNSDKKNENKTGWTMGTWFKFKRSNIHEAKLPDDKDPALIYDEKKGRWVDKENKDDDAGFNFKPPPTTTELKNFQNLDSESNNKINATFYDQNKPSAPLASSRPGNGYSITRGKGMKSNYVNVLANSQPSTRPPNMPTPPSFTSLQVPNMNLFVPPGQNSSAP